MCYHHLIMYNFAELCGDIPPSIAAAGKYSKQLFRKSGESDFIMRSKLSKLLPLKLTR